jgi:hypothetical protein
LDHFLPRLEPRAAPCRQLALECSAANGGGINYLIAMPSGGSFKEQRRKRRKSP